MDWRIPEKLKKGVSYARFLITLRSITGNVKGSAGRTGNAQSRMGALDHSPEINVAMSFLDCVFAGSPSALYQLLSIGTHEPMTGPYLGLEPQRAVVYFSHPGATA